MTPWPSLALLAGLLPALAGGREPLPPAPETAWQPLPASLHELAASPKPLVIKIAVNDIYCRKTACDCIDEIATRSFDTLVEQLEKRHQITLELTYFMEVFDLQKAVRAGTYQGYLCKPWTVLQYAKLGEERYKRVVDLLDPDNHPEMTGVFLATKGSPIRTLADLAGKRLATGQDDSFEKFQAPLRLLANRSIQPAKVLTYSSCGENLNALMAGEVDAAVISSYAFTASCAKDFAKPENFQILARTDRMPLTSLLVDLTRVPAADAARLQAALVAESGAKTPADLLGKGFVLPASWQPRNLTAAEKMVTDAIDKTAK